MQGLSRHTNLTTGPAMFNWAKVVEGDEALQLLIAKNGELWKEWSTSHQPGPDIVNPAGWAHSAFKVYVRKAMYFGYVWDVVCKVDLVG